MIPALTNHLWQSTVFAVAAGLLTLVLRQNHARVRYGLWLAASLKFLVPFQLLVRFGGHLAWHRSYTEAPAVFAIVQFSKPYAPIRHALAQTPVIPNLIPTLFLAIWLIGCAAVVLAWWNRWRRTASIIHAAEPVTNGRALETLRRLGARIPIVSSTAPLEPGVFGIWRPVLFLPARISKLLDDAQLDAILAHEASHVRRRDNLTAALHMMVEALFWFHPLVWWIGARLVEERENACDEAVLRSQSEPRAYAEGILKVCQYWLEAPVLCVSGVSGTDRKKRIQGIVANRTARDLDWSQRLLLVVTAIGAIAAPIGMGMLNAPPSLAQSQAGTTNQPLSQFEVASIRPAAQDEDRLFAPVQTVASTSLICR